MASTKTAKTQTPATQSATPTTNPVVLPETTETTVTLEQLRANRKAIEDQIKALKATAPKRESLAAEIAKQCEHPTLALVNSLGNYARQRVKLGQNPEQAKADLLAICGLLIDAGIATPAPKRTAKTAEAAAEPEAVAN